MGFFQQVQHDPIGAISSGVSNVVSGIGKDISNIPHDVSTLISNPKRQLEDTLDNPYAPALAGAALTAAGLGPVAAGLAVGGTEAAASGSLSKGVMAGIGAYGGANLATDVTTLGSQAAQDTAAQDAARNLGYGGVDSGTTAANMVNNGVMSTGDYTSITDAQNAAAAAAAATPLSTAASGISSAISNPSAALSTINPSGTALGTAASVAGNVLQAANGPNGNALIPSASTTASTPAATGTPYTATPGGNPSGLVYNRNAVDPATLNMIGSQYVQGAVPDTSERTYFKPTYSQSTPAQPAQPTQTLTPQQQMMAQFMGRDPTVTKSAIGGLQATPQAAMGNFNAPMSHNVNPVYNPIQQQMPVPQPVMNMASGGDPMDYGTDSVTGLPAKPIYAINPATGRPYAQDIAQSGLSGAALSDYVASQQAQQDINNDPNAIKAADGGSMGISAYASGGGAYNLGSYSDGGRLLRGPGDGVSDSIPATIGSKQPARLADGEFVVPARIVSELGNGSTEAGARKLYGMLDRIQHARRKTVGIGNVAKNSHADKHLPA